MNEIISKPKIPREIAKSVFIIVPRPVEILRRIKVITFLNNRPCRAFCRVLAVLLIEISPVGVQFSSSAESINTTSSRCQLKTICFLRLEVFLSGKYKKNEK